MIYKILLAVLITIPGYACDQDVTYLEKGKAAPCDGFLFSPKKEKEVRYQVETFKYVEDFTNTQGEMIDIMDKRITNLQEHNTMLSKELNRREKTKFLRQTFYFALGVLVTGAIAKNVP